MRTLSTRLPPAADDAVSKSIRRSQRTKEALARKRAADDAVSKSIRRCMSVVVG